MIHELKTETQFFEAIYNMEKTFEVRKNDRDFHVGDFLALNEIDDVTHAYTGRCMLIRITYILDDSRFVKDGYVILGISNSKVSIGESTNQGLYNVITYPRQHEKE